jgi:replicative DNA helicase
MVGQNNGGYWNDGRTGYRPAAALLADYLAQIQIDEAATIATGLTELDQALDGGLHPADLIVLAGRDDRSADALVLHLLLHTAVTHGRPVAFFSLKASRADISDRLLALRMGLPLAQMRRARQAADPGGHDAQGALADAPLHIWQAQHRTIQDICEEARRLKAAGALDLLIVDYLQLLVTGDTINRVDEVSRISRNLKLLAGELRCPVLALSRLNRAVEQRHNPIPKLSDLSGSGALEADADLVLFLYWEEMLNRTTRRAGIVEVHMAKHRNGPTGQVDVRCDSTTLCFSDLSRPGDVATSGGAE